MKAKLTFSLLLLSCSAFAQTRIEYIDSNGHPSSKENALYRHEINKKDTLYENVVYWEKSNALKSRYTWVGNNVAGRIIGLSLDYYENGQLEDSAYFYEPGKLAYKYHYYPGGQLYFRRIYNAAKDTYNDEAFRQNGKRADFSIVESPAQFPGGISGWIQYLERNLSRDLPTKNGAPPGQYTVYVSFIIDRQGKVNDVKALNNPGYGTAEEAMRVIRDGPDWIPAVQNGIKVVYRHRQGLTFVIAK